MTWTIPSGWRPVSAQEASRIDDHAAVEAAGRHLDARIDTGERHDPRRWSRC
jgi:hypothetical protein